MLNPTGSAMESFDDLPSMGQLNGVAPPPMPRVSSHPHLPKAVAGLRVSGGNAGYGAPPRNRIEVDSL